MLGGNLRNLEHQNFGFDPDGRYLVSIGSPLLANYKQEFLGNRNPIGQHFGPAPLRNAGTYEVVGVVQNIHYMTWGVRDPARALYYIPEAQTVPFDQRDLQRVTSLCRRISGTS
jgi:hypothetical protein